MSINIIQVQPGSTVNISGCGCGSCGNGSGDGWSSGGNGGNGGQLPPGGVPGGLDYDGYTKLIDVCASVQSIFVDPLLEWIDRVQSGALSLDLFVPIDLIDLIDDVNDSLQGLELELQTGTGIQTLIKERVVDVLPDPVTPFTRQTLQNLFIGEFPGGLGNVTALVNPPFPVIYAGAALYPALVLWSTTANLNTINAAMLAAKGTGNPDSGECAEIFASIGRPIYNPALPEPQLTTLSDTASNRKYTRVMFENVPANSSISKSYQVSQFVGYFEILTWTSNGETIGSGTAYNPTREYISDAGQTADTSGGFGSGSVTLGATYTHAFGKQGLTDAAKAFAPSEFSALTAGQPATDTDGLTYPQPAGGVVNINANFAQNVGADNFTIWIVTTLSGEVTAL